MDANDLTFVRIIHPAAFSLIPRYLFEQVEDLGTGPNRIDDIYAFGHSILMIPMANNETIQWIPNPFVHIAAMIDAEHIIKGFVWAVIDVLEKTVILAVLSLDKEYKSTNKATGKVVTEYLYKIPDSPEFKKFGIQKKIQMATVRPGAYERFGFVRSKKILMEIEERGE